MWTEYQSKIHHPQPHCRVSVVCTVDIGYSATNTGVVPPMSKLNCWNCHWVNNVSCFCCKRMAAPAHQLEKQLTRNQKQAETKLCSSNAALLQDWLLSQQHNTGHTASSNIRYSLCPKVCHRQLSNYAICLWGLWTSVAAPSAAVSKSHISAIKGGKPQTCLRSLPPHSSTSHSAAL